MKYYATLGPLKDGESRTITFDFTQVIGSSGATIQSATITPTVVNGTFASPTTTLSGSALVSTPYVQQTISSSAFGVTINYECKVTLSPVSGLSNQEPVIDARITTISLYE